MSDKIHISDVATMRELIDGMQTTGAQGYDLSGYAREWVVQKDGFEPSDVCALKPFAAAMDSIKEALDDAFWTFQSRWSGLTEGVADSVIDFERSEGHVVDSFEALLHKPVRVYVNGRLAYE